jgi:hypothetical protein
VFKAAAARDLHLAVAELPIAFFRRLNANFDEGRSRLSCLRSVLMKPEHREWLDRIWAALSDATDEVLGS